jgi:hypothetical protein
MNKEPVGSVAEEAAKLFAALQHAAADARGDHGTTPADDLPSAGEDDVRSGAEDGVRADAAAEAHEHKLGPDCQWCPICQLIHKLRTTSPETIEQLSKAAASVLGSVRSLLEAAAEAAQQTRADAESRTAREADKPTRSRVDRIDVSEDPEPWD